ncbi:MAG: hypothetical protein ABSB38_07750 [Dehalococcoidia bacterium]
MKNNFDVVIIGAGISGLMAGVNRTRTILNTNCEDSNCYYPYVNNHYQKFKPPPSSA